MKYSAKFLVVIVAASLVWGCSSRNTTITQNNLSQNTVAIAGGHAGAPAVEKDPRSDEQLEKLLPADTFAQDEFPKALVLAMMRTCLNKNLSQKTSLFYHSPKADGWCTCLTEKRVHAFALQDYMQADSANWDAKSFPEAAHKDSGIRAACLKKVEK